MGRWTSLLFLGQDVRKSPSQNHPTGKGVGRKAVQARLQYVPRPSQGPQICVTLLLTSFTVGCFGVGLLPTSFPYLAVCQMRLLCMLYHDRHNRNTQSTPPISSDRTWRGRNWGGASQVMEKWRHSRGSYAGQTKLPNRGDITTTTPWDVLLAALLRHMVIAATLLVLHVGGNGRIALIHGIPAQGGGGGHRHSLQWYCFLLIQSSQCCGIAGIDLSRPKAKPQRVRNSY